MSSNLNLSVTKKAIAEFCNAVGYDHKFHEIGYGNTPKDERRFNIVFRRYEEDVLHTAYFDVSRAGVVRLRFYTEGAFRGICVYHTLNHDAYRIKMLIKEAVLNTVNNEPEFVLKLDKDTYVAVKV